MVEEGYDSRVIHFQKQALRLSAMGRIRPSGHLMKFSLCLLVFAWGALTQANGARLLVGGGGLVDRGSKGTERRANRRTPVLLPRRPGWWGNGADRSFGRNQYREDAVCR